MRFANSYEWLGYPLRRLPNDVWVIQELLTAYQPQVSARCTTYCAHHAPPSHDTVPLSTLAYPLSTLEYPREPLEYY